MNYEQQVTITLSQAEASCLSAALWLYRYLLAESYDNRGKNGRKEVENAHPTSTTGVAYRLHHELGRVALGDKSQPHVSYKMVPTNKG